MKQYCAGIDVGGTSVKMGIFSVSGVLLEKWEILTRKEQGGAQILPDIASSLREHLAGRSMEVSDLEGVGLDVPGPVEPNGHVHVCVNLGWGPHDPARELSALFGGKVRCEVGNDANVAALGELWQGGGKGFQSLMMVTLGTGVGGGLILHERIVPGAHGAGAEIGHIHIVEGMERVCNCGGRGCLEQVASATGIVSEAKKILAKEKRESLLREKGEELSAKDICDAAKAGDVLANEILDHCMYYLSWVMAAISMTVDPELFLIGGGVSRAGDILLRKISGRFRELTPILSKRPEIRLATLGNDAGIYGSARMVLDRE